MIERWPTSILMTQIRHNFLKIDRLNNKRGLMDNKSAVRVKQLTVEIVSFLNGTEIKQQMLFKNLNKSSLEIFPVLRVMNFVVYILQQGMQYVAHSKFVQGISEKERKEIEEIHKETKIMCEHLHITLRFLIEGVNYKRKKELIIQGTKSKFYATVQVSAIKPE